MSGEIRNSFVLSVWIFHKSEIFISRDGPKSAKVRFSPCLAFARFIIAVSHFDGFSRDLENRKGENSFE